MLTNNVRKGQDYEREIITAVRSTLSPRIESTHNEHDIDRLA